MILDRLRRKPKSPIQRVRPDYLRWDGFRQGWGMAVMWHHGFENGLVDDHGSLSGFDPIDNRALATCSTRRWQVRPARHVLRHGEPDRVRGREPASGEHVCPTRRTEVSAMTMIRIDLARGADQTVCVLEILGEQGHTSITWNPDNPDEVEHARQEFQKLKDAGFLLFTIDEVDDLPVEAGRVMAELISAPAVVPATSPEPVSLPPKKGRQRKGTQAAAFVPTAPRTVAVRPMRGG